MNTNEDLNQAYWEERYHNHQTAWDIGAISPPMKSAIDQLAFQYPDKKDSLVLWGEYSEKITDLIKKMRDYKPYNFLFLALEVYDKDDQSRRFTGVDLNGKISQRVPALVDEVFQLTEFPTEAGGTVRKLVTSTYDKAIAGDRSGKLAQFEDPDMTNIIKKIHL